MTPRPRWRWWLFCGALWLSHRVNWAWVTDLMVWTIPPEWLGVVDGDDTANAGDGEAPW